MFDWRKIYVLNSTIANAFFFTRNGKFSLTIGMIMPLGCGEVTRIIPKLVTQGLFWFPTRHLWLVGNPNGLSWLVGKNPVPFPQPKGIKTVLLNLLDRHVQNLASQLPMAMCMYHPNQNQSFDYLGTWLIIFHTLPYWRR